VVVEDALAALEPLPSFDLPVVAFLPENYIKDQAQRLYFYQQMMSARTEDRLGEVESEVEDRYGRPPEAARNAFEIMALRMRAARVGIEKLDSRGGRLSVSFRSKEAIPPRVFSIVGRINRECYLSRDFFIWPYAGDPVLAVDRMLTAFDAAFKELEEARASLGV
jgi:transcription-repair coupling factor (superfamily II helicase)